MPDTQQRERVVAAAGGGGVPSPRFHLLGAEPQDWRDWVTGLQLESYRAEQIRRWVFERHATAFERMTDLSRVTREACAAGGDIYRGRISAESPAADGTTKLLITWPDGAAVEAVRIPEGERYTACISSQVGCPVGCRFCASGLEGVERNLTAGEIVEQAMWIRRRLVEADERHEAGEEKRGPARLSNVVLMGMGEPLANYAAVLKAIRIINSPDGMGIGARRITLSTVGLPAQIRRLADERLQINLALSLHATDDALRHELIPWGKGVPIRELVGACAYYFDQTHREITLEYVLLDGVNNLPKHAAQLAAIAKRLRCNVNLLRYNPVAGVTFQRPSAEAAFAFQRMLKDHNVNAHIRKSRGADVNAACGQLRRVSTSPASGTTTVIPVRRDSDSLPDAD